MITPSDALKFIACHEAIAAAGHDIGQNQSGWYSSNDVAVQAIIDGFTLADAKAQWKRRVDEKAKEKRDAEIASYSPGEMASWSIKSAEAAAFTVEPVDALDAQSKGVYLLWLEATSRSTTVADIAARVNSNGAMFMSLEAAIAGYAGKLKDQIDAALTFAAVLAIDPDAGWPV